jgi:hypothetical protein
VCAAGRQSATARRSGAIKADRRAACLMNARHAHSAATTLAHASGRY